MSLIDLDLNAKNYTINELRNMLNLTVPYTEEDIYDSSDKIKNKILNEDTLIDSKKEDILKFILKIEKILKLDLNVYCMKLNNLNDVNNNDYICIPEIDNKPNNDEKFLYWPKGASVLYFNKDLGCFQIYVKTSFHGESINWQIFDSNKKN